MRVHKRHSLRKVNCVLAGEDLFAHGSAVRIFSFMFSVDPSHNSANSFLTQEMTTMGPKVDGTCVYEKG